ncbi:ATP-binding protein [Alkalibacter saccharofermentans]|uniref:DNA replication protein DnaC n=1 Tax=Alkalibacter saccharofermentans DSM 14828 TaxID=1120975 RepID=A0A1M4THN1_9FIRM|nr:ATP-binding protein [Alkalibacter saccharofermentans]SHE43970.1 DNA replication protein DnaC [Alkalibacter saccharofermentans DSM 14828]
MKDPIYNDTLIEFNEKILRRKRIHKQRIDDLYKAMPQLKSLHDGINRAGLKLALSSIPGESHKNLENIKNEIASLKDDERSLLQSKGYPEDYLQYKPACKVCMDEGYVEGKRCNCFNSLLIEKYYDQSNLKNILSKENFDTFKMDYYSGDKGPYPVSPKLQMEKILLESIDFVKNFGEESLNLYFFGDPGLGKTFLSHCIAKELLDKGYVVIYQTASEIMDIVRRSKFSSNPEAYQNHPASYLYTCDLLIIDDLGTETLTEFANNELFTLINKRLKDNKKMIISTNLSVNQLEKRYSTRLASRVIGNFHFLEFFGEDIRMKKADIL